MLRRRYLFVLTLWVVLGAGVTARAQSPSPTGNGIRLGDALILHLGTGIELAWDSNVFYAPFNETNSFALRLTPHFDLTNSPRGTERQIVFDFHGGLNYLEWLTSDYRLHPLRQFGVDAGVLTSFFPLRAYNFSVFDNFTRTTQPPYQQTNRNFDRDTNELGFRVNLSPGGGRLTFNVGYLFGIDYFEIDTLKPFDLMYHRFDLRASWRFLPKTAVYIAASEVIYQYQHPDPVYPHPNSYPLRIDAGLQGLITTKLAVNLWIGYGNGFYDNSVKVNPSTVVAGVALTWKPTLLSSGTLGYNHDFVNSLLGAYYDLDQVYASWTQLIWRFTGFLRFAYANQRYQGIPPTAGLPLGQTTRTDNYITLNARADYPFKTWLWLSLGYDLQVNRSDSKLVFDPTMTAGGLPVDYIKHVVYLRLQFWY
jgi:hypothetical protein